MPNHEDLQRLGVALRKAREAKGEHSIRAFAEKVGVSHQHLSQIERAYIAPNRGLVIPSDEVLEKLAKGLDIPLSRLHGYLGRTPDVPFPAYSDPETAQVAERFFNLPQIEREVVLDVLETIERMVAKRGGNVAEEV